MITVEYDIQYDNVIVRMPRAVAARLNRREPITQFELPYIVDEVVNGLIGAETFMFLGYAAVMREAMHGQA